MLICYILNLWEMFSLIFSGVGVESVIICGYNECICLQCVIFYMFTHLWWLWFPVVMIICYFPYHYNHSYLLNLVRIVFSNRRYPGSVVTCRNLSVNLMEHPLSGYQSYSRHQASMDVLQEIQYWVKLWKWSDELQRSTPSFAYFYSMAQTGLNFYYIRVCQGKDCLKWWLSSPEAAPGSNGVCQAPGPRARGWTPRWRRSCWRCWRYRTCR